MRKINIGLTDEQRQGVIDLLNRDLADSYLLIIKTKKYHWDVVGPQFRSVHEMLEEQYEQLSENIDAIAERIRALGGYPIGTAESFLKLGSIQEHTGDLPTATEMMDRLADSNEMIVRNLRDHIEQCEEQFGDRVTADFLSQIAEGHEANAWMLRSFVEGEAIHPSGERSADEVKYPAGIK
ncbi:MAG: Dps family protein [Synechococcales bacterium]|nr:Dps family protein [Synechococcales bacterium]